jgi:hypothetical protein
MDYFTCAERVRKAAIVNTRERRNLAFIYIGFFGNKVL